MGAEPQETRGIPRNRKCGNCRFYEPAPLWRKGWCRNTKLYPPHANHLVDANTIDCEGGFRSRIYWEPLAAGQVAPSIASEERPITSSNVTPIKPITGPIKPITGQPFQPQTPANFAEPEPFASRETEPPTESYQTPMAASDRPTLSVYKHPLADRSFSIKSSDDTIRPVNTNPAPIISRTPNQNSNGNNQPPATTRQPFVQPVSSGSGDNNGNNSGPSENNGFPNYRSRVYGSQSQEPLNRNNNNASDSSRNYSPQPQDGPDRNYSGSNQDQEGYGFGSQDTVPSPSPRRYPPQETSRSFVTPPPSSGYGQVYGDNPDEMEEPEEFNEAAPPPSPSYEDQAPTRPYRAQSQYTPPSRPKQSQAWTEQDMPDRNQFDDMDDFPQGGGNNYSQPSSRDYPTQPGNYSSQYGTDKEPIRIQEALPANNRPRSYDPRKQSQPAPARFRPVKEDQPAANLPVTRDWRAILREKAPFTRNWNLEGITMNRQILPWAIGVVLVLILAVVLVANIGKKPDSNSPTVPPGTAAASVTIATTPGSTTSAGTGATTGASKTTAAGTTAAATTAAATTPATKTAVVKGTGGDGLNMRETPSKTGNKLASIKDGEKVTIKDGPKDADGLTWYQIEYNGKTGWAASSYLELQQ
ncbi:MAG: SH3 domain-containing protein [Chloroflexi bacterium]|nr:SH3 domain-containing protein [Chloroflexota bacterium]